MEPWSSFEERGAGWPSMVADFEVVRSGEAPPTV